MTAFLEVTRRAVDEKQLRRTYAPQPPDDALIVRAPAVLIADGAVVAAVGNVDASRMFAALARPLPWSGGGEPRLSGFQPRVLAWGFAPPVPLRRRYGCAQCAFDRDYEEIADTVRASSERGWEIVSSLAPAEASAHAERVEAAVLPDWRIGRLPFTSGVINDTAQLPYHCDASNLRDAWSLQVVARRDVEGGLLHLPGLDIWLACDDGDVLFFKGQSEMHGVAPVRRVGRNARRFTTVAYVKSQMRNCLSAEEEPIRAATAATEANRRKTRRAG
jgi:hypothetical protein